MKYVLLSLSTLHKIVEKIGSIYTEVAGFLLSLLIIPLVTFFGGVRLDMMKLVVIAVALDLGWGTWSSIKRKQWLCSTSVQSTIIKIIVYGTMFSIVAVIEKGISEEFMWLSRLTCIVLCTSEAWSIFAHILIIKPNFPVIRLLRKVLAGEISKKLGITEDVFAGIMRQKMCKIVETKVCDDCGDCKITKTDNNEQG